MTPTKHPRRTGTFPIPSQYFAAKAASHQRIADSSGYRNHPEARTAELLEMAHYSSLAAEALAREQQRKYPDDAIERARSAALEWLEGNTDGYPRSWRHEDAEDKRRGYVMYDDFEAPPIAGYEALERGGLAVRLETLDPGGHERIHFRLVKQAVGDPSHASTSKTVA